MVPSGSARGSVHLVLPVRGTALGEPGSMRSVQPAALWLPVLAVAAGVLLAGAGENGSDQRGHWRISGQDLGNHRHQPGEHRISPSNVGALVPRWFFDADGEVSATPTIDGDALYFPDWAGKVYALNRHTGHVLWSISVPSLDEIAGAVVRTSPAVYRDELIFGDNQRRLGLHYGANLMAVDRFTGNLRWITRIDSHPAAVVTGPAVVYGDVIYQGVSSNEENLAESPSYRCCTFRGSLVAVNARNGHILWKTYVMPDNHGSPDQYSGGGIWQPPAIDPERGLLYVGTGNNYSVPASVLACQAGNPDAVQCASANDYFDTALALDLRTGKIRWAQRLWGYDAWTVACIHPWKGGTCPSPTGDDYDMGGSGPNLLPGMIGFGQKSGIYWALNPSNGSVRWGTPVGPGGFNGGVQWGTATDGQRIYTASANSEHTNHILIGGQVTKGGAWSALDLKSGRILWQTADPTPGAVDSGAVSVANEVVYAGSLSGYMYAFDAVTGKILWSFNSGGSVIDGPAIVDGDVYWGCGYAPLATVNRVYDFRLPSSSEAHDSDE